MRGKKKASVLHNKEGQKGAIIVEATISLSIFMFTIFTMLSVIQIAYTQSRMTVALTCATKEMAEYAHVYYATGMNESFSGSGGKSSELFGKVGEFMGSIGGELGSLGSELSQYYTEGGEIISETGEVITQGGTAMDATSLTKLFTNGISYALARQLMEKNLVADKSNSAEDFFKRNHVSDLDFAESKFLEGAEPEIFMHVKYKIQVVQLLDIDFSFQMSTWAYARAWTGSGD